MVVAVVVVVGEVEVLREGERGGEREREVEERGDACRWWEGGKLNSGMVSSLFSRRDAWVLGEEEEGRSVFLKEE